jgi:hypothetical protein
LWPEHEVRASFSPLVDLGLGDAGTDVALRLAERLNVPPQQIIERIQGAWRPTGLAEVRVVRGYLNVTFPDDAQNLYVTEDVSFRGDVSRAIVLAPQSGAASAAANLRLACGGAAQHAIVRALGGAATLFWGAEAMKGDATEDVFRLLMERVLNEAEAPREDEIVASTRALLERPDFEVTLRLQPQSLSRRSFTAICEADGGREALHIVAPPAPQFSFRAGQLDLSALKVLSLDPLFALLWYFTEAVPALDLDLFVATSDEKANLLWYWRSTCERIGTHMPSLAAQIEGAAEPASPMLRDLAMRTRFLRSFYVAGAEAGRVSDFLLVLRSMLDSLNRAFNAPDVRTRLAAGQLDPATAKIIAGACQSLSANITLYDFFEGLSYGSSAGTAHTTDRKTSGNHE